MHRGIGADWSVWHLTSDKTVPVLPLISVPQADGDTMRDISVPLVRCMMVRWHVAISTRQIGSVLIVSVGNGVDGVVIHSLLVVWSLRLINLQQSAEPTLSHHLVKHNPHISSDAHKELNKIQKKRSAQNWGGLSGSDFSVHCFPFGCFKLKGLCDEATAPKFKAREGKTRRRQWQDGKTVYTYRLMCFIFPRDSRLMWW